MAKKEKSDPCPNGGTPLEHGKYGTCCKAGSYPKAFSISSGKGHLCCHSDETPSLLYKDNIYYVMCCPTGQTLQETANGTQCAPKRSGDPLSGVNVVPALYSYCLQLGYSQQYCSNLSAAATKSSKNYAVSPYASEPTLYPTYHTTYPGYQHRIPSYHPITHTDPSTICYANCKKQAAACLKKYANTKTALGCGIVEGYCYQGCALDYMPM